MHRRAATSTIASALARSPSHAATPGGGLPQLLLSLQTTAGNRAVAGTLCVQRDRAPLRTSSSSERTPIRTSTSERRVPINSGGGSGTGRRVLVNAGGGSVRYTFQYGGKVYQLAEPEYELLLHGIAARLQSSLLPAAREGFDNVVHGYNYLVRLYNSQRVVGWLLDTFSGAELPDKELERARASLHQATAAVATVRSQNPPRGMSVLQATEALRRTEQQIRLVEQLLRRYTDDIVDAGESTVRVLQITSTAAFTIASVAGGAVLAAPVLVGGAGMGAVASGAITTAGTSLLAAMSDTAGRAMVGEDLVWTDEFLKWGKKGIIGAVAGGAGGAMVSKVAGPLSSRLAARLGARFPDVPAEILQTHVKNAIEGGLGNTVQGAIADTAEAMQGNITASQFLDNVAANLIAGGFAGAFQAKFMVDRKGYHQVGTAGAGW
jgi:hypothetical protein